jgi:hypothetical protein
MLPTTALAAGLFLLPQLSLAGLAKRQDATTSATVAADAPSTTLEPVLPPDDDPDDFSILNPDPNAVLYYGGVPNTTVSKRDDADAGILVDLDIKFLYPSVPLDHSSFISGIACSGDNTLSGVFSTQAAYDFGKKNWADLQKLILISSAEGCGMDSQNDVFLATSVTFTDSDLAFTATGSEQLIKDVAETTTIEWGNTAPQKLRKRAHKRGVCINSIEMRCSC